MAGTDFETYRKYLTGIAYRMLGSYAEAEDVVQDVYIRWHKVDHETVVDPKSFLARVATRLCLDILKGRGRCGMSPRNGSGRPGHEKSPGAQVPRLSIR